MKAPSSTRCSNRQSAPVLPELWREMDPRRRRHEPERGEILRQPLAGRLDERLFQSPQPKKAPRPLCFRQGGEPGDFLRREIAIGHLEVDGAGEVFEIEAELPIGPGSRGEPDHSGRVGQVKRQRRRRATDPGDRLAVRSGDEIPGSRRRTELRCQSGAQQRVRSNEFDPVPDKHEPRRAPTFGVVEQVAPRRGRRLVEPVDAHRPHKHGQRIAHRAKNTLLVAEWRSGRRLPTGAARVMRRVMRLLAISDLHLAAQQNRAALSALPASPEDWLIIAGDLCENANLFAAALEFLARRFACVIWVPGNHELWLSNREAGIGGSQRKYKALVDTARRLGVVTPEDEFPAWPPGGEIVVPMMTLYDYSFRPDDVPLAEVVRWAAEINNVCADEHLINPKPDSGIAEWCARRCAETEARLERELPAGARTVLIGHYPLREELVRIPRIPASRHGAARGAPPTGISAIAPSRRSAAICMCAAPTGATGRGSRRYRSAIRASGTRQRALPPICARFCRATPRPADQPLLITRIDIAGLNL